MNAGPAFIEPTRTTWTYLILIFSTRSRRSGPTALILSKARVKPSRPCGHLESNSASHWTTTASRRSRRCMNATHAADRRLTRTSGYAPATTTDLRSNDVTMDMIACGHDVNHPMPRRGLAAVRRGLRAADPGSRRQPEGYRRHDRGERNHDCESALFDQGKVGRRMDRVSGLCHGGTSRRQIAMSSTAPSPGSSIASSSRRLPPCSTRELTDMTMSHARDTNSSRRASRTGRSSSWLRPSESSGSASFAEEMDLRIERR